MLVAEEYLGSVEADDALRERVEREGALTVTLDATDRRRSRVRTTATDGTDVGIVVGRELVDGDVLAADDRLLLIELASIDALAVDLSAIEPTRAALLAALEAGHVAGNRHWDLAIEGTTAYLPATEDRERMVDEITDALPDDATLSFDAVSPALFDGEVADHGHPHGDHSHPHGAAGGVRSLDVDGGEES